MRRSSSFSHLQSAIGSVPLVSLVGSIFVGCGTSHRVDDAGMSADGLGSDVSSVACRCCDGSTSTVSDPLECERRCASRTCSDAGAPDGGGCGAVAAEIVCFDATRESELVVLSVSLDPTRTRCFCGQDLGCRVAGEGRDLTLETVLCPDRSDCEACMPSPIARCEVNVREPGARRLLISGEPALELEFGPSAAPTCVRAATPNGCGAMFEPRTLVSDRVCHATRAQPGTQLPVRVEAVCGGCEAVGPCTVTLDGDVLRVAPTVMPSACDVACPPVCLHTEHVCLTPPLPAGRYTLAIEGFSPMSDVTLPTIDVSEDVVEPMPQCTGAER